MYIDDSTFNILGSDGKQLEKPITNLETQNLISKTKG